MLLGRESFRSAPRDSMSYRYHGKCGLSLPARPEGHAYSSPGDILNFQQVGLPLWLDLIPHCAAGNWLVVLCDQVLILGHLLLLEGSQRQASARAACRLTGSKQPTSTLRMHHSPSSIICDMLHVRTAEVALWNSGAYSHNVRVMTARIVGERHQFTAPV